MTIKVPKVGTDVEVVISNDTSWMLLPSPNRALITGKVVKSEAWDGENTFRVFTGRQNAPTSVIPISIVLKITDSKGKTVKMDTPRQVEKAEPKIDAWQVVGSKGDIYTVTRTDNYWTCSCVAFQMRRNCRHIKQKQEELSKVKNTA